MDLKTYSQKWLVRKLIQMPDSLALKLSGGQPIERRGYRLCPKMQLMAYLSERGEPLHETCHRETRKIWDTFSDTHDPNPPKMWSAVDHVVDHLTLRVYTPYKSMVRLPALVYFHGGGHVIGSVETHDAICRRFAEGAHARVISVEYRLAPEHPFPAATEDAYKAYQWVYENADTLGIDRHRIGVAGDSAGGNLAAVVSLKSRDQGYARPALQVLLYPMTDLQTDTRSYRDFAQGFTLTQDLMKWFISHYIKDEEHLMHPYAAPLRADSLHDLPATIIATAGFDPLLDEGEAFANRLLEDGVDVHYMMHSNQMHGYAGMAGTVPSALKALNEVISVTHNKLRSP